MPPKSRNLTLVAFDAEASKVTAVPDKAVPLEGMRTLVVGGAGDEAPASEANHGTINEVHASPTLRRKATSGLAPEPAR